MHEEILKTVHDFINIHANVLLFLSTGRDNKFLDIKLWRKLFLTLQNKQFSDVFGRTLHSYIGNEIGFIIRMNRL